MNSVLGTSYDYKTLERLSTDEWVKLTSNLKGALSDAEGNRMDLAVPNIRDKEEVWEKFLTGLDAELQTEIDNSKVWFDAHAEDRLSDAGFGEQEPTTQTGIQGLDSI